MSATIGPYLAIVSVIALFAPGSFADMGAITVYGDVTIEEPAQKAIIAHDGFEEVLVLSTDLKAPKKTGALRFIPFPSEPAVSLAPEGCFENLGGILERHAVKYLHQTRSREEAQSEGAKVGVQHRYLARDRRVAAAVEQRIGHKTDHRDEEAPRRGAYAEEGQPGTQGDPRFPEGVRPPLPPR
jgi:hypothetical protein